MKKGFSLVELLVSLVIISIIVVFISSFVLNLRDEKGDITIDVPFYVTHASISRTLNYDAIKRGGIYNISISNVGKTCTITYVDDTSINGVIQINNTGDTLTYTYNGNVEYVGSLSGDKTFTSVEIPTGYPKTYGSKNLYKYIINISNDNDIEVVSYN